MTAESELRPSSQPWGEIELTPEIDTPQKRPSAVLNIVQNGAQTLTVLTMPPDTENWQSYRQIHRHLNGCVGYELIRDNRTTKDHLVACIEPVGAAARSSLDDKNWALTEFGIKIKPALVFAWQRLLALELDAMQVFGAHSRSKKDQENNILATTATIRNRILLSLADDDRRSIDLSNIVNISLSYTPKILQKLQSAGLVEYQSVNTESGSSASHFYLTEKGHKTSPWPIYRNIAGNLLTRSPQVEKAIRKLTMEEKLVTSESVTAQISEDTQQPINKTDRHTNVGVLSFYARQGFLKRGKFFKYHFSEACLTSLGKQVVHEIIVPLVAWANDNKAIGEINEIGKQLKINPDSYKSLYPQIAAGFSENSPNKNSDLEAKSRQILALVKTYPNHLTAADLARQMKVGDSTIGELLKPLIATGQISQRKAEKGKMLFLAPGPNMPDFDAEYEEELNREEKIL